MGHLAKIDEQQQTNAPALTTESQAVLSMIERVVLNPEADMDKLDKMLDMQERILNRNAKQAFTADLAAMQAELPLVAKRGTGHNNAKFAKLEDINEAIRPTLQKYGFAVTFRVKQNDNRLLVVAILSHREGHSEETELVLPLDTSGNKNGVQAVGSTVSYGKRYALCALLNISTGDDDDGASAESISPEDAAWVKKELQATGSNVKKFCEALQIQNVDSMPAAKLAQAKALLQKKRSAAK